MYAYRRPISLHFAFYEICFMIESSVIGKLKRIFDINQCVGGAIFPLKNTRLGNVWILSMLTLYSPVNNFVHVRTGKLVEQSCHQFRFWYIKHMCKPAVFTYIYMYKYKYLINMIKPDI